MRIEEGEEINKLHKNKIKFKIEKSANQILSFRQILKDNLINDQKGELRIGF